MFRTFVVFAALAAAPATSMAAQHEGMPGMPQAGQGVNPQLVAACVQSQQQVMAAADAASRRLEVARQTNQPAALRAAMDDLQTALSSMRTQLAPCATLQAVAAPAAHDMANMPGMANTPASAAPAAAKPAAPTMVMVMTAVDPVKLKCSTKVEPTAAPKTTYKGKTYFFCSEKERAEFLTNPDMSLSMRPPL